MLHAWTVWLKLKLPNILLGIVTCWIYQGEERRPTARNHLNLLQLHFGIAFRIVSGGKQLLPVQKLDSILEWLDRNVTVPHAFSSAFSFLLYMIFALFYYFVFWYFWFILMLFHHCLFLTYFTFLLLLSCCWWL